MFCLISRLFYLQKHEDWWGEIVERFPSESVLSKAKIKAERIDKQFSNQCVVYSKKPWKKLLLPKSSKSDWPPSDCSVWDISGLLKINWGRQWSSRLWLVRYGQLGHRGTWGHGGYTGGKPRGESQITIVRPSVRSSGQWQTQESSSWWHDKVPITQCHHHNTGSKVL